MQDQACRERGTEFFEIKEALEAIGKKNESLLIRLTTIGNRLMDESNVEQKENKIPEPASRILLPGAVTDFNNIISALTKISDRTEQQISKLEKIL